MHERVDLPLAFPVVVGLLFAEKRAFQCERVHDVVLAEDDDARRRLFAPLNSESAILEAEERVFLAAHQWDDPELGVLNAPLLLVVLVAAPVEEGILLP